MKNIVNLDILHEMTDRDPEMEHRLFKSFLSSSVKCITSLQASWHEGMENTWRQQAHAFKGLCLNMGAERLSQLCEKAQDNCTAPPEQKRKLLVAIQNEFENVRQYLEKLN